MNNSLCFMKRAIIIIIFIWSPSLSFAQRNYAQEFVDLLMENRCMEARELYQQHADMLPLNDRAFYLLYKSKMDFFFNKPDSGAIYAEELLGNNNYQIPLGITVFEFYRKLMRHYSFNQKFEDGIELSDKMAAFMKRNPFDLDQNLIKNNLIEIEKFKISLQERAKNEPLVKIERIRNMKDKTIKLYKDEYIRFDAKYNDVQIETLFDTDAGHYFFIEKKLADKIGVKTVKKNQDSLLIIGGIETKAYEGMIDCIDLNSVRLYNIPVLVFLEKFSPQLSDSLDNQTRKMIERKYSDKQIIMGLSTMLLIGNLEFDWKKNTLSFPEDSSRKKDNNSSNMFLIDNKLFLNLYINGLNYSGYLNTGSDDFITIKKQLYEKNKNLIEIDSVVRKPLNYFTRFNNYWDVPYEQVKNTTVDFIGKTINHEKGEILVVDKFPSIETLDGIVGVRFLKRLTPKVNVDFDNMEIK